MGGKFSHTLEVLLPWILLNINFLKENRHYPHAGCENFYASIFSKLLLGQCTGASSPLSLHSWSCLSFHAAIVSPQLSSPLAQLYSLTQCSCPISRRRLTCGWILSRLNSLPDILLLSQDRTGLVSLARCAALLTVHTNGGVIECIS